MTSPTKKVNVKGKSKQKNNRSASFNKVWNEFIKLQPLRKQLMGV